LCNGYLLAQEIERIALYSQDQTYCQFINCFILKQPLVWVHLAVSLFIALPKDVEQPGRVVREKLPKTISTGLNSLFETVGSRLRNDRRLWATIRIFPAPFHTAADYLERGFRVNQHRLPKNCRTRFHMKTKKKSKVDDLLATNRSEGTSCDDILLGWKKNKMKSIGFVQTDFRSQEEAPVRFSGPHLVTIAPTGAGKGVGAAIPTLLEYPGQVLCLDVKGELYTTTSRARREMGQQVIKLDPFRLIGEDTDSLNPMDLLNLPLADLETDCETLAKMLAAGKEFSRDPFWALTANGLNSGLLMHVAHSVDEEEKSLSRIADMLHNDDAAYHLAVLLERKGKSMQKSAHREIAAFLNLPERETRPSTMATAQSYLKCLMSHKIATSISSTSFDLEAFRRGVPMTIYIIVPPERMLSHAALLSLWIGTLLKVIFSRTSAPKLRTLALLDEVASLGNFPMLETAITLCRSYGLRVWTFWQDVQQIQAAYPLGWKTVINNSSLQIFGVTTRLMANELGQVIDFEPSQLVRLNRESQVIQIPGQEPIVCALPNYLRDKRYSGRFDANRLHSTDEVALER